MASNFFKVFLLLVAGILGGCVTSPAYKASSEKQAQLTIRTHGNEVNNWFIHYKGSMIGAKCSAFAREVVAILNNVSIYRSFADGGRKLQEVTVALSADGTPFRIATMNVQTSLSGYTWHEKDCWPQVQFTPQPGHHYYLDDELLLNVCGMKLTEGSDAVPVASAKHLPPCWDEYTERSRKNFIEDFHAKHPHLYN
jgi:hypothetical protein